MIKNKAVSYRDQQKCRKLTEFEQKPEIQTEDKEKKEDNHEGNHTD